MDQNERLARWAVVGRWIASVGAGLIVALCYFVFQPIYAQERSADRGLSIERTLGDPPQAAPDQPGKAASARRAGDGKLSQEEIDRKAESALAESEADRKDAKPQQSAVNAESFDILDVVRKGGVHMWAVYAILGVSVIALAFAIERILGLRRSKILPSDLVAGLRALAGRKGDFDLRHAQRLCKQHPSSLAVVVRAMLAKVGRTIPEIESAMNDASQREATRLYANVRWQNLAFNVAPMLGLAGTVHGMIIAFFVTAHMQVGANKMESLATGIYAALVCTFAGLMVAIPAGVLAHILEGRIMRLFAELEDVVRSLIPHLERFEGRSRLKSSDKGAEKGLGDKSQGEPVTLELSSEDGANEGKKSQWPAIAPQE
jgi:biopolymer transport protein ExbB